MDHSGALPNGNGISKLNFLDSLPASYEEAGSAVVRWVHEHPQKAALYSLGIGVILGVTGVSRLIFAVQMARNLKSAISPSE